MIWSANPIIERMTLVWHNHFATSNAKVASVPLMHQQNELLRRHSIGSFESMLNDMSRDPAMLIWLDGGNNKRRAPNENFARELFELFGLGIGNYTEKDIKESARSFTGWTLRASQFYYDESQHDPKPKTVLGKTGPWTGGDVVRITVEHPACARFIALKILREFAENDPSPQAIDAFATVLRQHKMEIAPSLRTLFQSEYFYHADRLGAVIKSPIQLVVGSLISLRANDESLPNTSVHLANVVRLLGRLGQDVFEPPNVKGWDGGRTWIQSATMLDRIRFVSALVHKSDFGTIPASNAITQSKLSAGNPQASPNRDVANANKVNGVPKSTLDVLSATLLAQPINSAQRKELAGLSGGCSVRVTGIRSCCIRCLHCPSINWLKGVMFDWAFVHRSSEEIHVPLETLQRNSR